jgi:hypothetical protein
MPGACPECRGFCSRALVFSLLQGMGAHIAQIVPPAVRPCMTIEMSSQVVQAGCPPEWGVGGCASSASMSRISHDIGWVAATQAKQAVQAPSARPPVRMLGFL